MKYFVSARLSENISKTPEGFLVCIGVPICRTGEQIYGSEETPLEPDSNGKVTITRPEDEVFRPETLASFEGKSVTITHPEEFVNPKNWKRLTVGTMQNIRRGEGEYSDSALADLLITDEVGIKRVEDGLREVSCGYEADYEQEEPGKGVQRNIIGNHLALVDQGRAGPSYAINDHKGKVTNTMKIKDTIKAIFAKAQDEAMAAADQLGEQSPQDPSSGKPAMAKDAYDEVKKMCDALMSKIDAMSKSKDADEEPPAAKKKEKEEKSEDEEGGEQGLEARLSKLEGMVAKLLESKASGDEDAEEEESEDADADEEESEDDDFEESTMVGDSALEEGTASRAEILAPGHEFTKNVKVRALKEAYATKDGKTIIDALSGGKTPAWDSKEKIDTLFVAASEVMKAKRVRDNAKTKQVRDSGNPSGDEHAGKVMTAEAINEINKKHYGLNH